MALKTSENVKAHIRSNLVGYVALFCFAVGGTAIANHGDPNSITSRDIVNGQVRKADVAVNAITEPKIAPAAVGASAIADGAVGAAEVNEAALDSSVLQARVAGSCGPGEAIRAISADGAVACEPDDIGEGPASDVTCTGCIDNSEIVPTNLNADLLDGQSGSFYQDASNLTAGTVPVARLPDVTRAINLPLTAFVTEGSAIPFSDGPDDFPNLEYSTNSANIKYDSVSGEVDDRYITSTLMLPPDYVSGGSLSLRLSGGASNPQESIECRVGVNGGSASGTNVVTTIPNNTDTQSVLVTPVPDVDLPYNAGASVSVHCRQGNASANNDVRIYAIEFRYTAAQ